MPRKNYFPKDDGFSGTLLRGGTETADQERERRMAYDAGTLEMERGVTQQMANIMELKRQQTATGMEQRVLQQSAAVLPAIEALDPLADDYDKQLLGVMRGNPYAHRDPAVKDVIGLQGEARKLYFDTKEQADERERRNLERTKLTAESIRGNVSQLGADYLGLYDESIKGGLDPIAANAKVASRAESNKIRQQLIQAGLTDEDIAPLQAEAGDIDTGKAQQALASLIPREAFTAASKVVSDYDDRIKDQKITIEELSPEDRDQYNNAKSTQLAYINQLNRKRKPAGAAETAAAPVKRVVIRNGAIVK